MERTALENVEMLQWLYEEYMEQMKLSVQKHLQDMSRGEYDKGILQKSMDFDGLL